MTRPNLSPIVVDGNTVKLRLLAERSEGPHVVHVDWLRFTVYTRNAPVDDVEKLFPAPEYWDGNYWEVKAKERNLVLQRLRASEYFDPAMQALELAESVAAALGEGFDVDTEIGKGHDFYGHRWSITLGGKEVGWVGFGASGDGKNQKRQKETIHCNLYGAACTFAASGWRDRIAAIVERAQGHITRIDLAADFFDGYAGGIEQVKADYMAGLCNVNGKKPKSNMVGDWCNGNSRSLYIGSKEAGKQTNVYEKGHQIYGADSYSQWLRFELRYGNKLRFIPIDAIRDPDAYFAAASDYHARVLRELKQKATTPKPIKCKTDLPSETVAGEVYRNVKWLKNVAAPSISAALKFLSFEHLLTLIDPDNDKLPARLQAYASGKLATAYQRVMEQVFILAGKSPIPA